MKTPEFSRIERADAIGEGERHVTAAATAEERAALARRFDVKAIDALAGEFSLRRDPAGIIVRGRVTAAVVQACVVTDEPVPANIDEEIALHLVAGDGAGDDEIELDPQAIDTIPFDGAAIDLGEIAAETMALALDPYPRAAGAAEALKRYGVVSEEEAGPFGALAVLRGKLGDQS